MLRMPITAVLLAATTFPVAAQGDAVERLSELQGSAYIGRNRHVVGATVKVLPETDASRVYLTSSDGEGTFRVLGLPDGDYSVSVKRDGFAPVVKDDVGLKFPFRRVLEVPMSRIEVSEAAAPGPSADPADLQQRIDLAGSVSSDGVELPDVQLRLTRPDGLEDPRLLQSTQTGLFESFDLSAGEWILDVNGVGFIPIRTRLDLRADTEIRISLIHQPASYEPSPLELMPEERPIPPAGFLQP